MSCYGSIIWFPVPLYWFHFLWFVILPPFTGFQTAKLPLCYLTHFNFIVYNPTSNWTIAMSTPIFHAYNFLFAASADFLKFLFTEPFKQLLFCLCSKIRFGELNTTLFQSCSLSLLVESSSEWLCQFESDKISPLGAQVEVILSSHFLWMLPCVFILLYYSIESICQAWIITVMGFFSVARG